MYLSNLQNNKIFWIELSHIERACYPAYKRIAGSAFSTSVLILSSNVRISPQAVFHHIIHQKSHIVQLHEHGGDGMQLNRAVSIRLMELLSEKDMTQYQLSTKSGLPRSTISNIINCTYPSMKLRIVHEVCQGLEIGINEFFSSPLFDETNLEP